ncbi:hypothetical protein LUZ60_001145 [Juncus effusus]|nr:hypothetical protein LUZ60_001145 [Juncus effusus]
MEFLEMPYEPISFRFHSLVASSAGGSLLTCLAVLAAAAVGFWRMRTNGSRPDASSILTSSSSSEEEEALKKVVPEPVQVHEEAVRSMEYEAVSPSCSDGMNTPKIRFMAYFDSESSIGCCHLEDEDEEEEIEDYCSCEESDYKEASLPRLEKEKEEVKYWEEMVLKKRDLGWYSFQDMAVLNGSVVRLWDGDSSISSPRKRKTGRLAISSF